MDEIECEQSLVAICYSNRILGMACYQELNNTISCNTFHAAPEEINQILMSIKSILNPTIFLLHPKIITNKPIFDIILSGTDNSEAAYRFKVLKSTVWNDKTSSQLIHNSLNIRGSSQYDPSISNYQQIACIVDLEREQCRQALGALIAYMQESVFKLDSGKVVVSAIKSYTEESFVYIDSTSFNALQIFSEEVHPNVMKGKGRSKEGFSLFGLFDRTHSLSGRQRLRDWMARPLSDKANIRYRQIGVSLVARQSNRDFVCGCSSLLRHFHDLPRLLLRVKKVEATHVDWCKIHTSMLTAQKLLDHLSGFVTSPLTDPDDGVYIRELFSLVDFDAVQTQTEALTNAIDFNESEAESSVVFREGYDAALDKMRQVYDQLETHLIQAAHRVLEIAPLVQNVSVEYLPQIGYLVAVQEGELHLLEHSLPPPSDIIPEPAPILEEPNMGILDETFVDWSEPHEAYHTAVTFSDADGQIRSSTKQTGFRFVFAQSGVHYFKHFIVDALDESIGDIKSDIADRQRALLLQVEDHMLEAEAPLQNLTIALSTLDALISLGTLAVEQHLTAPEIVDEPVVLVKAGRHLLQELTVDNFVPNDTFLSKEKNIALISGPNASGKSVYLKQVALIVYLAHIGSFVPCERARIGLVDRIMTRISSTETVSAPQSAFALDLQQVSRMLRSHTERSLCLIDEFGKGTMPVDGIALLASVVKHFAEHGGVAMFVLHFTEILHDAVLSAQTMQSVSCFRMEMMQLPISPDQDEDDDHYQERTPLFTLKKGVTVSSEGIPCAHNAGINTNILNRASEIKRNISKSEPIRIVLTACSSVLHNSNNIQLLTLFLNTKDWIGMEGSEQLVQVKKLL